MSPRERVVAALQHRQPDRVPFAWNFGPTPEMTIELERYLAPRGIHWQRLRAATDDVLNVSPKYIGPKLPATVDLWGIGRRSTSYGSGSYDEMTVHPLAGVDDVDAIHAYSWPNPEAFDYEALRGDILVADPAHRRAHKLAIDVCGNPLEIYCWMTGLEEALINMVAQPELARAALDHITRYFEAKQRRALAVCADLVDILYYADDLGGQAGLLVSRRMYGDVVKPFHARLIRLGKLLAPRAAAMLHSDGAVFDILPNLMDAGVEVLEAVQTDALGMQPARLKRAFGERLAFHGGISVQALLPHCDEREVYEECRRLVEVFGAGGGYIAAPSHAIQVGTPPQNVLSMLRAVLGDEDYAAALADSAR
jgi:uroporphyrinogen decarboxylase